MSGNFATGLKNGGFLPLKRLLLGVAVGLGVVEVVVDVSTVNEDEDNPLMDSGVTNVTPTSSSSSTFGRTCSTNYAH